MASGSTNPRQHGAETPLVTTPDPASEILLWLAAGGNAMCTLTNAALQALSGGALVRKPLRLGSAFNASSGTTPLQITDLTYGSAAGSVALVAGASYRFLAELSFDADATGGHKYAMGGTATATAVEYHILSIANASSLNVITSRQTALAGAAGQAGATAGLTIIRGSIVVSAGGTFGPQFSRNAATGTSTVRAGSVFQVWPA